MENELSIGPPVSVVITTFNRLESTKRAIKSVLSQSVELEELIVVEDGCRSGIESWLKRKNFDGVKYIRHKANRGLAASRNTGLLSARGEYIAFIDDDDEWLPEKIEKQMAKFNDLSKDIFEKTGVIYCKTAIRNEDGDLVDGTVDLNHGNLKKSIIKYGPKTASSSFLFVSKALKKVGGFDENLVSSIDHDIWMALASFDYHAYYVDENLVISDQRTGRDTMMVDTERRMIGVRQFLDKWSPAMQDWLGQQRGTKFAQHYFSRVISNLVLAKISVGRNREAWKATRSIFDYCPDWRFNMQNILRAVSVGVVKRMVPNHLLRKIRFWRR